MTPLMKLGYERFIVQEDLDDIDSQDVSEELGRKLQYYWDKEQTKKRCISTLYLTNLIVGTLMRMWD
jgi:hypothetical protein